MTLCSGVCSHIPVPQKLKMNCSVCKCLLSSDELVKKIKCDSCTVAVCQGCSGLSATEVRVMQLSGGRSLKFFCTLCENSDRSSLRNNKVDGGEQDQEAGRFDGRDSLIEKVLKNQQLLFSKLDSCCACKESYSGIMKENAELRKAVKSQNEIIVNMQGEFNQQIMEIRQILSRQHIEIMGKLSADKVDKPVNRGRSSPHAATQRQKSINTTGHNAASVDRSPQRDRKDIQSRLPAGKQAGGSGVVQTSVRPAALTNQASEEGWTVVERRSNRKTAVKIVGKMNSGSGAALRVIPRKLHFFLSRLSPDTNSEDVVDFLKQDFPEVECQPLEVKFPGKYASFKVTVDAQNGEKLLDASIWPSGALVAEFFQPRRVKNRQA